MKWWIPIAMILAVLAAFWLSACNKPSCVPPPNVNPRILTSGEHFCECLQVDAHDHITQAWAARKDGMCYAEDMP